MEPNENTMELLDKIEKYLAGNLPENERREFERQMKRDSKLADEVEAYRAINFALANKDYRGLKNELLQAKDIIADVRRSVQVKYDAETEESPAQETVRNVEQRVDIIAGLLDKVREFLFPSTPVFRLAYAVATIAILLVPSYLIFFSGPSAASLYADNFSPYPNVITPSSRSEGEENLGELEKAMLFYEKKEYQKAQETFSGYLENNPANYEAMFYSGITNLELGNFQQAQSDFDNVIKNNGSFSEHAKWYKALLYLKNRKKKEATKALKAIYDEGGAYSEKAELIMDELNK